ncbi:MAG: AraC family transcriptional regulator [Synergistes sp.]|nr:AraC family transcriptional regulator [Synergistes sp.]
MLVISRTQKLNSLSKHFHKGLEILLTLSDGGKLWINNREYPIEYGALFVMNSTDFHNNIGDSEDAEYKFCAVDFEPDEVCCLTSKNFDLLSCFRDHRNFVHRRLLGEGQTDELLKMIRQLDLYLSPDCRIYGKEVYSKTTLAEILVFVNAVYEMPECGGKLAAADVQRDEKLGPVIEYINEHYAEDMSIDEIAEKFYMSRSNLCRLFKKTTGTTINGYVTNIRIFKAMDLLRAGYNVNFTSELVGFKSASHFITLFTKLEGISPKQYTKILSSAQEFDWILSSEAD